MCAIAGLFRLKGTLSSSEEEAVKNMGRAQSHRGPDDEGFFRHPRCALAHRRLSIIDTSSAGHQPWASEDGKIQLVYNGEIYNFRSLRQELEAGGARFRSNTDTEVVAQGYRAWGCDTLLGRLRGMFAFGLLDLTEASHPRLFLARDRFGIKPLYYAQNSECLLFASEVRALASSGLVPTDQDPHALTQFLQLGSVPSPLTTIKAIRSLPAGEAMMLDSAPASPRAYWSFSEVLGQSPRDLTPESAVSETRRLLEETVQQHLMSDVPTGLFLSGGIDSSALVGLARRGVSGPLTTLSVVFEESRFDESSYAQRVAQHYHTDHREIRLGAHEWKRRLPDVFSAMDQPTIDGVNTWFVSDAARQAGLKVVLSGLGSDELFSGYRHLQQARRIETAVRLSARVPGVLRQALLKTVSSFLPPALARKRWCFENITAATPYWLARGIFSPTMISRLTGQDIPKVRQNLDVGTADSAVEDLDSQARMRWFEYHYYLQNQLLKDSDVMSMAHSIELRIPFLDHELVSQVLSMPAVDKAYPGVPKALLVRAMGDDFPREVWDRPKQGFTFPFEEWLQAEAPAFEAMALEKTPLKSSAVREVWSAFRSGQEHWSRAWMTVVAARVYGH